MELIMVVMSENLMPNLNNIKNEEETEIENSDDLQLKPDSFEDITVSYSDWTVGTIFSQIGKQIDLQPDFQRRNVWSHRAKSLFIESLFLGIPVPQILLATIKDKKGSFIVLDGKQRLLALHEFINGETRDKKVFKLQGLKIITQLNNKSWKNIKADEDLESQFINESIRTAVIRNSPSEAALYEIFYRLNSGSVKLSPMELRMALHPGEFLKFTIQWTEELGALHKLLKLKEPDTRMSDVELVIKYLAYKFSNQEYKGNLKLYLDEFCEYANKNFEQLESKFRFELDNLNRAIELGMEIFPNDTFCRKFNPENQYTNRFNRALFDVLVGSLSQQIFYEYAQVNKIKVKDEYERLCVNDEDFLTAVEHTTKSIPNTRKRFESWYDIVNNLINNRLDMPKIQS